MSSAARRLLVIPVTVFVVVVVLLLAAPTAMQRYDAYDMRFGPGAGCRPIGQTVFRAGQPPSVQSCPTVADANRRPLEELLVDAAARSLVLLVGAAILAATVGTLLGVTAALLRRRALASGGVVGVMSILAAVPSFFAAYFLQIVVIVVGAREGGNILPVQGFGYDSHIVLPLLAISIPAVAYTAQLVATRMQEVLDADFVTTANAKGLLPSWIVRIHVLPHVRPVLIESIGSGLRVSVASLPIVEFLFNWRGIGQLSLQSVALRDVNAFIGCAVVLVVLFATLSAIADLSRPRALYRVA
ncbi:MAG: ABC transporter permease [Chloroflexota bacterium]|nr:ABC transporter permease [Chloroflexota bacterium]